MKKTIIALMALASGTALAEDAALLWDLTYTGTNYAITDANGDAYTTLSYYNATSTTVEDGVCTTKGTGERLLLKDSNTHGLTLGGDYSFVIQGGAVTNPSDWATLFGLGNINSNTDPNRAQIKISDSSSGNLGIYGEDSIFSDISSTTQTPVGEMGTYILTMQANDDNTASTATLYYNGTVVCSATITDTTGKTAWRDKDLAYFTIGGRLRDANSLTQMAITNVQLYNGVLSDSQIASLSIPEPTTATLSLLALAGLAARRRRR